MAPTFIFSIPTDLLVRAILRHLSVRDVLRFCSTCRRFSRLPTTDVYLAYHLELLIAGLVDNLRCPQDTCPVSSRLQALRERETRWTQVRIKWTKVYSTPRLSRWYADLSGGGSYAFGKLINTEHGAHLSEFYSTQLPSTRSRALTWSRLPLIDNERLLGFACFQEDQDLVVHATSTSQNGHEFVNIYLFSYTLQKPHPLASSFILNISAGGMSTEDRYRGRAPIAVWGDTLALVANYAVGDGEFKDVLHVWNWKTGFRKGFIELSTSLSITGLVFLRDDLLLLPNQEKNRLEVYRLRSAPPQDLSGYPSISPTTRCTGVIEPVLYLSLPAINPGVRLVIRGCQSSGITSPSHHHAPPTRPFINDVQSSIVVVHLQYYRSNFNSEKFMYSLFIDRPSLLSQATHATNAAPTHLGPAGPYLGAPRTPFATVASLPVRVSWEGWGYHTTRWVNNTSECVLSVSGTRWAHCAEDDSSDVQAWKDAIEVLDFAPLRVSRLAHGPRTQVKNSQFYTRNQPTVLPARDGIFTKDVYSCLPYARHVHENSQSDVRYLGDKQFWHKRAVSIDEERIVGLVITTDENAFQAMDVLYFG